MTPQLIPYKMAVLLYFSWGTFFYWYIVLANGPLMREKSFTFFENCQLNAEKEYGGKVPRWLLIMHLITHASGMYFAVLFAWPYYGIKWAAGQLHIAYWLLRVEWARLSKQISKRGTHTATWLMVNPTLPPTPPARPDPLCYCGAPLSEHRLGGVMHQYWPAGLSNQEIERRMTQASRI